MISRSAHSFTRSVPKETPNRPGGLSGLGPSIPTRSRARLRIVDSRLPRAGYCKFSLQTYPVMSPSVSPPPGSPAARTFRFVVERFGKAGSTSVMSRTHGCLARPTCAFPLAAPTPIGGALRSGPGRTAPRPSSSGSPRNSSFQSPGKPTCGRPSGRPPLRSARTIGGYSAKSGRCARSRRRIQVPVYFDFEGPWAHFAASGPPIAYPRSLCSEAQASTKFLSREPTPNGRMAARKLLARKTH